MLQVGCRHNRSKTVAPESTVYIHVVVLFTLLVNVITIWLICLSGQILTKSNYSSLFHL